MNCAYLALGSNLANPLNQINVALTSLDTIPYTYRIATSSFYLSDPYGFLEQPDYLNAVVALKTLLPAELLLDFIQNIELNQGRIRQPKRWTSRTLDIDILLFGNQVINTPRLTIPHYDIHNRSFFLVPLFEIAPQLLLPNGRSLAELFIQINKNNIRLLLR